MSGGVGSSRDNTSSESSLSAGVRIYEFNQTKFTPVFEQIGVPQWRVSHLSDIPYLLNEDVAAGADNWGAQKELSRRFAGSVAAFAWTGDVNVASGGEGYDGWPPAYGDLDRARRSRGRRLWRGVRLSILSMKNLGFEQLYPRMIS